MSKSIKKYPVESEEECFSSIFEPTAPEIEAALCHERRNKRKEQEFEPRMSCSDESVLQPEDIDVFLVECDATKVEEGRKHAVTANIMKSGDKYAQEEQNGIIKRVRCKSDQTITFETEDEKLLSGFRAPDVTTHSAPNYSQEASTSQTVGTKGPFKPPVAAYTPSSRYAERRSGVCEAIDDTSAARMKRRALQKRFPDLYV